MAGSKRISPKVLITRAKEDAALLAQAVRRCGGEPVCVPAVETHDLPLAMSTEHGQTLLQACDAIAFTSRRGARRWAEVCLQLGLAVRPEVRLFAVGPSTQSEVQRLFAASCAVSVPHTAAGVASLLVQELPRGAHVLLPTAKDAGGPLAAKLLTANITATLLPLYQTAALIPSAEAMALGRRVDYILFTSPSCVRSWARWGRDLLIPQANARVLTMGPSTSEQAKRCGLQVFAEAKPSSFAGLEALLRAHL